MALAELVALGRKHNLPVIDDVGSGRCSTSAASASRASRLAHSIAAGADLVLFSGDKLLGGPQAGIIAGRKELIQKIEKDPLMRAFRLDKMTLAALEATLRLYLHEERALREVPVLRMLNTPLAELCRRANLLASKMWGEIKGIAAATVAEYVAYVGGGSLPDQTMKSVVIQVEADAVSDDELSRRLRTGTPAIMGRLQDGKLRSAFAHCIPRARNALVGSGPASLAGTGHCSCITPLSGTTFFAVVDESPR